MHLVEDHADGNAVAYFDTLDLANTGSQPLLLDALGWSAAATGGWIVRPDHEQLLGGGLSIAAGSTFSMPIYQRFHDWPAHVVVRANSAVEDVLVELPIVADAATTWPAGVDQPAALAAGAVLSPATFDASPPVFVGLMEPVEMVPLSDGRNCVAVTGQLVNCSARNLTLTRWKLTLRPRWLRIPLQGHTLVDATPPTFKPADDLFGTDVDLSTSPGLAAHSAVGFIAAYDIDWNGGGWLTIELDLTDGTATTTVTHTVRLGTAPTVELRAPVEWVAPLGVLWGFGNGPGADHFHVHNIFPDRRYAYDIGLNEPNGEWKIDTSAPGDNWNFLCWSRPIVAMADGTVVTADSSAHDHAPGITAGPQNSVILRHDDARFPNHLYTVYVHMRHGSVTVRVGDRVSAGDPIALVGDNGWSSAPHLHVSCFTYDDAARIRALPMAFVNLEQGHTGAVTPADGARFPIAPG